MMKNLEESKNFGIFIKDTMKPVSVIQSFDDFLVTKRLTFEAVVIGGAALAMLGEISRETQDCDVLDPEIPAEVLRASQEFAREVQLPETSLKENWLNHGPESLRPLLRSGWKMRLVPLFQGKAIQFYTLDRMDLLGTKLLAFCDRGQDLADCVALSPTREELETLIPWLNHLDANPKWPKQLAKRIGYGF
jgi:hypothetical protein